MELLGFKYLYSSVFAVVVEFVDRKELQLASPLMPHYQGIDPRHMPAILSLSSSISLIYFLHLLGLF